MRPGSVPVRARPEGPDSRDERTHPGLRQRSTPSGAAVVRSPAYGCATLTSRRTLPRPFGWRVAPAVWRDTCHVLSSRSPGAVGQRALVRRFGQRRPRPGLPGPPYFSGTAEPAVAGMTYLGDQLRARTEHARWSMPGRRRSWRRRSWRGMAPLARVCAGPERERARSRLRAAAGGRSQDYEVVAGGALCGSMSDHFTGSVSAWPRNRLWACARELRPATDSGLMASLILATVQGGCVLERARQDLVEFRRVVDGWQQVGRGPRAPTGDGARSVADGTRLGSCASHLRR